MKVEIEIPDGWYRAPNGWGEDVLWKDGPDGKPDQLTGQGRAPMPWVESEVLAVLVPLVPQRCPGHVKTPGYLPCGNLCTFGDTDCPVAPLGVAPRG